MVSIGLGNVIDDPGAVDEVEFAADDVQQLWIIYVAGEAFVAGYAQLAAPFIELSPPTIAERLYVDHGQTRGAGPERPGDPLFWVFQSPPTSAKLNPEA